MGGATRNYGTSYTVDPWGNLTNTPVTKCSAYAMNTTADKLNRITGHTYDSAGNMKDRTFA